jgi:hypothetical protein
MLKLKPEYLTRNGQKQFVILTIEEFDRVREALEDADDLRTLRAAKQRGRGKPLIPHAQIMREFGVTAPRGKKKIR